MAAPDVPALDLEHFLPYRLSVLSNTVSSALAGAYARRFGLTIPQWRVIAVLARTPGLSAAAVAERTAMDKVAVSRAVTGLVRAGRVRRALAAADRRRSVLSLTARGMLVYGRIIPLALAYERRLLAELSPAEQSQFDALLSRLQKRSGLLGPAGSPRV
ncbi:MAG: MarR family winged helix-turn-helix transcriptional regulator [Pseudomonadota bacterium]|nr:MarR family winged helix-turn-helix transcriptional regulator [Pseudomonadota bacterium]